MTIPRGYVTIPLLRRRPPAQILRSGLAREIARSKAKSLTHWLIKPTMLIGRHDTIERRENSEMISSENGSR